MQQRTREKPQDNKNKTKKPKPFPAPSPPPYNPYPPGILPADIDSELARVLREIDVVISENDPEEQEKRIKYNDLVANAVILHNAVDMTRIIRGLHAEGQKISRETLSQLSPYLTRHISRFGDYIVDLSRQPQPLHEESELLV